MNMMTSYPDVMLDANQVTVGVPLPDSMHHRLGKLHNGTQQRMAFDHSDNQSLHDGGIRFQ
ncbi:MAG: hypothetical protein ACRYF2_23205 [Janthinobacterium lividum]